MTPPAHPLMRAELSLGLGCVGCSGHAVCTQVAGCLLSPSLEGKGQRGRSVTPRSPFLGSDLGNRSQWQEGEGGWDVGWATVLGLSPWRLPHWNL